MKTRLAAAVAGIIVLGIATLPNAVSADPRLAAGLAGVGQDANSVTKIHGYRGYRRHYGYRRYYRRYRRNYRRYYRRYYGYRPYRRYYRPYYSRRYYRPYYRRYW